MTERTASPGPQSPTASFLDGPFRVVLVMTLVLAVLVGGVVVRSALAPSTATPSATPTASTGASLDPAAFLYATARPAPRLALTDQDGAAFDLASLRGRPALVFFGYTHCPDVCPATMGIIGQVLTAYGSADLRAVFVTVDPERDTVPFLKDYVRYLAPGITAVTGTATEIRTTADAWGVRYARVETDTPGSYSMSHTADVYLVDADGQLRAHFPFGTQADAMLGGVRAVAAATASPAASTAASPSATASATPGPASATPGGSAPVADLRVEAISSSVWAGGDSPLIFRLRGPEGPLSDTSASVRVQLQGTYGDAVGPPVTARPVRPEGVDTVSWVATLDIPDTGWWDVAVTVTTPTATRTGRGSLSAQDPGSTARLGASAPSVRTPTLSDVSGLALAITTDPVPDLRMSRTSTADALAAGRPFVLVIDSVRFRVTPVCGKAVVLAKYLLDRWPGVTFVHLEPYRYSVISDTAVLDGSLSSPSLVDAATAWGIGAPPWGATSMPWVFVVDGQGIVRAKYQGIVGSDDVDVILSLIAAGG